jgi:hypothetical protein
MYKAFLYKDFISLRFKGRSFVFLAIGAVVIIVMLAFGISDLSELIFGMDFVILAGLSMPGLAAFLEFYASSLAVDKSSGILALVMLSGMSKVKYFSVKVIIPLGIAIVTSFLVVPGYLLLVSQTGFTLKILLPFYAIIVSELFLAMGIGMLFNTLFDIDIKSNPSIAYVLILANFPILYIANPMVHFTLFIALTFGLSLISYIASAVILSRMYNNNLAGSLVIEQPYSEQGE